MQAPDWWNGDVSRETLDKLQAYAELIRKWSPKINLIARSTLDEVEMRHIWDGAQVYQKRPGKWADLGSGGGLPGAIVAIMAQAENVDTQVTLVESDQRKCTFLRTCARELNVPMDIVAERVEKMEPLKANTISARALASLDQLLEWSAPHLAADGLCIFQKGAQWKSEVEVAEINWRFSYDAMQSKTNSEAVVLKIKDITRV